MDTVAVDGRVTVAAAVAHVRRSSHFSAALQLA